LLVFPFPLLNSLSPLSFPCVWGISLSLFRCFPTLQGKRFWFFFRLRGTYLLLRFVSAPHRTDKLNFPPPTSSRRFPFLTVPHPRVPVFSLVGSVFPMLLSIRLPPPLFCPLPLSFVSGHVVFTVNDHTLWVEPPSFYAVTRGRSSVRPLFSFPGTPFFPPSPFPLRRLCRF